MKKYISIIFIIISYINTNAQGTFETIENHWQNQRIITIVRQKFFLRLKKGQLTILPQIVMFDLPHLNYNYE
jgi:hypothetical protein